MRLLRTIIITVFLAAPASVAWGGDGSGRMKFHFGAEWGLGLTLVEKSHEVYIAKEGYLVDSRSMRSSHHFNGSVLGFVEADLGRRLSLAASSGYMGLCRNCRVIPVLMRVSYALGREGIGKAGAVFAEGGAGFDPGHETSVIGRSGYHYRYMLTSHFAVDLRFAFLVSSSHPDIYDDYSDVYVPSEDMRQNDRINGGLMFTIGIVF